MGNYFDEPTLQQHGDDYDRFVQRISQINMVCQNNITFFKTTFEVDTIDIEVCLSDKNILPSDFRKKVYKWCGSGVDIKINYSIAGLQSVKIYEA